MWSVHFLRFVTDAISEKVVVNIDCVGGCIVVSIDLNNSHMTPPYIFVVSKMLYPSIEGAKRISDLKEEVHTNYTPPQRPLEASSLKCTEHLGGTNADSRNASQMKYSKTPARCWTNVCAQCVYGTNDFLFIPTRPHYRDLGL